MDGGRAPFGAVPVMADESCYTLQDAMALARAGAADILSMYVGKGGGIGPAQEDCKRCGGCGTDLHDRKQSGTGDCERCDGPCCGRDYRPSAAEEFPCDILGPIAYEHDLLRESLDYRDGSVAVPDRPGSVSRSTKTMLAPLSGFGLTGVPPLAEFVHSVARLLGFSQLLIRATKQVVHATVRIFWRCFEDLDGLGGHATGGTSDCAR